MMTYRYLKSQKGVTPTGAIIFIVVMLLIVLFTLAIGKPYLSSVFFNKEIQTITKDCIKKSDSSFIAKIKNLAAEKGFWLKEKDIIIERYDEASLTVRIKYYYDLEIPMLETKTLEFKTSSEQVLDTAKRDDDFGEREWGRKKKKKPMSLFQKLKDLIDIL